MKFPIKGQGVFLFKGGNSDKVVIKFLNADETNILKLVIDKHVLIYRNEIECKDPNNQSGIIHLHGAYYWISINAQNQQIYVGVGGPRLETVIYHYSMTHKEKAFLESLEHSDFAFSRFSKIPLQEQCHYVLKTQMN